MKNDDIRDGSSWFYCRPKKKKIKKSHRTSPVRLKNQSPGSSVGGGSGRGSPNQSHLSPSSGNMMRNDDEKQDNCAKAVSPTATDNNNNKQKHSHKRRRQRPSSNSSSPMAGGDDCDDDDASSVTSTWTETALQEAAPARLSVSTAASTAANPPYASAPKNDAYSFEGPLTVAASNSHNHDGSEDDGRLTRLQKIEVARLRAALRDKKIVFTEQSHMQQISYTLHKHRLIEQWKVAQELRKSLEKAADKAAKHSDTKSYNSFVTASATTPSSDNACNSTAAAANSPVVSTNLAARYPLTSASPVADTVTATDLRRKKRKTFKCINMKHIHELASLTQAFKSGHTLDSYDGYKKKYDQEQKEEQEQIQRSQKVILDHLDRMVKEEQQPHEQTHDQQQSQQNRHDYHHKSASSTSQYQQNQHLDQQRHQQNSKVKSAQNIIISPNTTSKSLLFSNSLDIRATYQDASNRLVNIKTVKVITGSLHIKLSARIPMAARATTGNTTKKKTVSSSLSVLPVKNQKAPPPKNSYCDGNNIKSNNKQPRYRMHPVTNRQPQQQQQLKGETGTVQGTLSVNSPPASITVLNNNNGFPANQVPPGKQSDNFVVAGTGVAAANNANIMAKSSSTDYYNHDLHNDTDDSNTLTPCNSSVSSFVNSSQPPRPRKCHVCKKMKLLYKKCHYFHASGVKCSRIYCCDCLREYDDIDDTKNDNKSLNQKTKPKLNKNSSPISNSNGKNHNGASGPNIASNSLDDNEQVWHCPACLGICRCQSCTKTYQKLRGKRQPTRSVTRHHGNVPR